MSKSTIVAAVLRKRMGVLENNVLPNTKNEELRQYYLGKIEGYRQAIDLLSGSLEGATVELK